MATYPPQMGAPRAFVPGIAAVPQAAPAPAGTFLPGTKVQVGSHRVIIDRYLSEGGFAHVYVVTLPKPIEATEKAVLKRVAVPDKEHLANMRTEVETMKRLRGHKHIVKYMDSHASPLKNGGYEVFLLMEWCDGGGLIDFMNTRLQNRLTEPEILNIFTDVTEGVACMHYLKPALLHRDLKVENVLISTKGKARIYKLCDFGSAAPPRPAATSAAEGRLIEDDVQRHTTLQYRSPEMIDVYRKQPIDEKSDIWALGVFLYKLCYYTTPFEEVGQMAILNATFKYPGYPRFSDDLKLLIASMLRELPSQRPNIYQVLAKACKMDGRPLPLQDIYSGRAKSEDARNKALPQPPSSSQPQAGATLAPPSHDSGPVVPQIEPMRRGRPTRPTSHHASAKPSPSPLRMMDGPDPFSHLDGKNTAGGDELSSRFPRLEEFSLLTDKTPKFAFGSDSQQPKQNEVVGNDLAKRVTDALADDAFARTATLQKAKPTVSAKPDIGRESAESESKIIIGAKDVSSGTSGPVPVPKSSNMVSTGTMTSPSVSTPPVDSLPVRRIWRVPSKDKVDRSATVAHAPSKTRPVITKNKSGSRLAHLLKDDAARSQSVDETETRAPISSRPSLEGGRPLLRDLDSGMHRSRSLNVRNRPASVNIGVHSREAKEKETHQNSHGANQAVPLVNEAHAPNNKVHQTDTNISSDVEFLKAREEEERERTKHMKRLSSGSRHQKRSSLPSIALSGTKNILSGRFGDAFRKFEGHGGQNNHGNDAGDPLRTPSPLMDEKQVLTPIAGSEATDLSEDRHVGDETEELSPELRRELEKQKLEAEERRVEKAAAQYRSQVRSKGGAPQLPSAKAASIQNRVQSLLLENKRPAQKTATGYGRFTHEVLQEPHFSGSAPVEIPTASPLDRASVSAPTSTTNLQAQGRLPRPMAPPKPRVLRTGRDDNAAGNVARDVGQPLSADDWEAQFSKRYPSLSHIEMVETEIETAHPSQGKMREV